MKPTEEQDAAIAAFRTGKSLAIEAGAGTGKTSTLVLIAEDAGPKRRGQYVAFNKSLVMDSAGKFPLSVAANTAHSLAFRAVGHRFQRQLNAPRMPGYKVASILGINGMDVTDFEDKPKYLNPGYLASHAMKAVTAFCQSADPRIEAHHFPYLDGLDAPVNGRRTFATNNEIARELLPFADLAWRSLNTPGSNVPFKHEHYLKMYQLNDPHIDADYILFDEAQDANPVIAAIVAAQKHAQLVYVGDSQQEIYAWTGAINALASVDVAQRTFLSQSFRFGDAIAEQANVILEELGSELILRGNPDIASIVGTLALPRAILTRTNAAGITRLLELQSRGRSAHFLGGSTDVLAFARAAEELMNAGHTNYPELSCFDNWQAVRAYVRDINEDGADLRLQVKLVEDFGTETIINALQRMPPEDHAEVVISTAHKSKGRQWPSVQLATDFRFPDDKEPQPSELRLLYVAITRAQHQLDIDAIEEVPDPI